METLLTTVDRFAGRFASLTGLVDKVASKLLVKTEARAYGCTTSYCGTYCRNGDRFVKFYWSDCLGSQCHYYCACDRYVSKC